MKLRATKKEIRENYGRIYGTGYCNLQYLLYYRQPFGYSSRAEGWACDYYDVNGLCISTGYAPLNSRNVKTPDYDTRQAYEDRAREIVYGPIKDWDQKKLAVDLLLAEFLEKEVLK